MKALSTPLFILALLLFSGCAGAGYLTEGGNSIVRYQQFDTSSGDMTLELVLVQESHKNYQNLYDEVRENANMKKIPLAKFEYLVETLADLGYMDIVEASAGSVSSSRAIVIESDAGRWTARNWTGCDETEGLTDEQHYDFLEMMAVVRDCYDSVLGLQVIHKGLGTGGENLFLEEQKKLKEQNKMRGKQ